MRCVSTAKFAEMFPQTLRRAKVARLTGVVSQPTRRDPDCFWVKWDQLKTRQQLHKSFFRVLPEAVAA